LATGVGRSGEAPGGADTPTAEEAARIPGLVKGLASWDPKVRKTAREALMEIGRPALAALREAARSKDLEVATTAADMVKAIEKMPRKPRPKRPAKRHPAPTPAQAKSIAGFIKDLAAERPGTRERGKRGLLEIGKPALGALRRAKKSPDVEVATTAADLIKLIEKRSQVIISRVGGGKLGTRQVTVTTMIETFIVDGSADGVSVQIIPAKGEEKVYKAADWAEFKTKHPKIWKGYADIALDEKKQGQLMVEISLKALRPTLVKKLTAAYGRAPTEKELAEWTAKVRSQLEDAYVHKKKSDPEAPRAKPGGGPALVPLE
jgi:hypothetical protein